MSWTVLGETAQKGHVLDLSRAWKGKSIIILLHPCLELSRDGLIDVFSSIPNSAGI